MVPTFCIDIKALPAAEQFLLARYTLHQQVYFHKATRCIERLIAEILRLVAEAASTDDYLKSLTGLDSDHPLIRFFKTQNPTVQDYLDLDDIVIFGALERLERAEEKKISDLATRLRERNLYKTLDSRAFHPDSGWQVAGIKKVDKWISQNKIEAFKDPDARLSIYTEVGGDEERAHKKLRILEADGKRIAEITSASSYLSEVGSLILTRYYFANENDRERAKELGAKT